MLQHILFYYPSFVLFFSNFCPSELPLIASSGGYIEKQFQWQVWRLSFLVQCGSPRDTWLKTSSLSAVSLLFCEVRRHVMKLEPLASFNGDLRFLWVCTQANVASLPSAMACQHFDKRSGRQLVRRFTLAHVQKGFFVRRVLGGKYIHLHLLFKRKQ